MVYAGQDMSISKVGSACEFLRLETDPLVDWDNRECLGLRQAGASPRDVSAGRYREPCASPESLEFTDL